MKATLRIVIATAIAVCVVGCERDNPGSPAMDKPAGGKSISDPGDDTENHGYDERDNNSHDPEVSASRLRLTPAQIDSAGIELAEVRPAQIRESLPLYGVIAPNAERTRAVAARFPGAIRTIRKRVGDSVRQGETLATVESDESLQTYSVVAPLTGVITARYANPGEHTSDKALFTVTDLSTVWVELSLFPRDVAQVRVGQAVRVKRSDAHLVADGKLVYVAPFGSTSNQTLSARVLLDNRERKWPPGLYVTAEVTLATSCVPHAISNQAVQTLDDKNVVFVRTPDGFEARPVRLGRNDGELTEVLAGLNTPARYATVNSFILKAELGKGAASHEH